MHDSHRNEAIWMLRCDSMKRVSTENNQTIESGRLILVAELLFVDRRLLRKNFTISKGGNFRRSFIKNHRVPSALSLSYFIP